MVLKPLTKIDPAPHIEFVRVLVLAEYNNTFVNVYEPRLKETKGDYQINLDGPLGFNI